MSTSEQKLAITLQKTLLEVGLKRLTLFSWSVNIVLLPLLLIGLHLLGHYLQGFPDTLDSHFWRELFLIPTLVMYLLMTWPFIKRLFREAIASFHQVLLVNRAEFELMITKAVFFNPRFEFLSFFLGALVGCLIFRPWRLGQNFLPYLLLGDSLLFGLFVWEIYISLESAKFFTTLFRRPIKFNILQSNTLEPVAQWSLGVTMIFMGIATIGVLFVPSANILEIKYIVCYGTALILSVSIFFLGMRDTHQFILKMKKQELDKLYEGFNPAYQNFLVCLKQGEMNTPTTQYQSTLMSTLFLCEKRIREIPDWPYTSTILWKFAITLLLPSLLALL
ncbi:MAG: hypothetical protein AABZ60_02480 [Planctomycetota bacterium]